MRQPGHLLRRFLKATDGSNAIEFAILATPFVLLLVGVVQIGIYFVAQSALDLGLMRTADSLRQTFNSTATSFPNAATLKSRVSGYASGLSNSSTLKVEIQPITSLTSGARALVDGTNNYGTSTSVLALRASARVISFLPGVPAWTINSSALVRRQGR
jgi:Flp pilus assembly protein TadG